MKNYGEIGCISLGLIGLSMSKRVINSGYELFVHDMNPEPLRQSLMQRKFICWVLRSA